MKWKLFLGILLFLGTISYLSGCGGQNNETPGPAEAFVPGSWKADGIIEAGEYRHTVTRSDFDVHYTVDDVYAWFGLKARTAGWVAIGFEPSSRMKDADLVLGMVKNGEAMISDQFSTDMYGPHFPDTELGGTNDILDYGGREENGYTVIEFKRLLATDDEFDRDITGDSVSIIIAYGSTDDFSRQHAWRQSLRINTN